MQKVSVKDVVADAIRNEPDLVSNELKELHFPKTSAPSKMLRKNPKRIQKRSKVKRMK